MKKQQLFLIFITTLGFTACKKENSIPLPSSHLKIEVDLNGISATNIDSAFVVATKDQQKKRLTLAINDSKGLAESKEIKDGAWNLEIQLYTKKDTKKLFYKLVKGSITPAATAYQYKCPTLPTSNMKTISLDGWDVFYMYYLQKATIVLPYFSDNPRSEVWVKSASDWNYVYADRIYYNSSTPTNNVPVASVAIDLYDPLPLQNKILAINHTELASRLLNKTWNNVDLMMILMNDKTGEESVVHHQWK